MTQDDITTDDESLEYWAAADTRTCADEAVKRCEDYWNFCNSRGWFSLWRRLYYAYNPNRYTIGQTLKSGANNEYRVSRANHFRNILEHVQNLSINDRPVWQAQSVNSDSRSQKQTIIAEGVLDYYMREKRVERHLRDATRFALLFGEGFVSEEWDTAGGDAVATDPDSGRTVTDGDIRYSSHESVDVVRDPNLKHFSKRSWVVVRTYENKYELAKKYPEYAQEIVDTDGTLTAKNHYLAGQFLDHSFDTDEIPIYRFFHVKSTAVPDGRQMVMLPDGTVLSDTVLLYQHLPLHRIVPNDQIGTAMGQSISWDLLPVQECYDAHLTTALSINENFAIPKVLLPIGSDIPAEQMGQGFQSIIYNKDAGKPEVMDMPTAPPALFQAMETFKRDMETLSGVNAVTRGDPPNSLQSGSALALVQSMAIQFNAPLQQSYVQLLEDVGTATIQILQDYANTPRIIQIAGKRNKGIIQQSFSSEDLDGISRVQVQVGNPMSKTVSGRLAIAQDLLMNKIVTTAQEYLMVLETGELEPLTQGPTSELLNLASENELLLEGTDVPVLFTDNHVLHIQEHTAIASDPTVRSDPNLFGLISKHLMEHIAMLSDPNYQNFRQLMGQPSLPPAGAAQAGPPGMPGMGGTPANPGAMVTPGQPMPNSQIQGMADGIQPPQSPVNKLTGERPPLAQPV